MSKSKSTSKSKSAAKSPTKNKSKATSAASTRSQAGKSSKPKAVETVAKKAKTAPPAQKSVEAIGRSTYLTIHNLRQWMADEFERVTKEAPTLAQFEVLNAIASAEGPSQTFICRKTGMDRSTVAEVTRRLVTRGFVTRQRTQQDERAYAVTLTAEGRKMHALGADVMSTIETKLHSIQGFQSAVNWATKVLDTYGVPVNYAQGGGSGAGTTGMKGNGDGKHTSERTESTRIRTASAADAAAHPIDDFDDDDIDSGADDADTDRVAA